MSLRASLRSLLALTDEGGVLCDHRSLVGRLRGRVRVVGTLAHSTSSSCTSGGAVRELDLTALLQLRHCQSCTPAHLGGVVLVAPWAGSHRELSALQEAVEMCEVAARGHGLTADTTPGRVAGVSEELSRSARSAERLVSQSAGGGWDPRLTALLGDVEREISRARAAVASHLVTEKSQVLERLRAALLPREQDATTFALDESPVLVGIAPPLTGWEGTRMTRQAVEGCTITQDSRGVVAVMPRYAVDHLMRTLECATPHRSGKVVTAVAAPRDEVTRRTAAALWNPASRDGLASMVTALEMAEAALSSEE